MSERSIDEEYRLIGLHLGKRAKGEAKWIDYDIGGIALLALKALKPAILAIEQVVTGERRVKSLDVGDFYQSINEALVVENGQGILSEVGSMSSLQDEIDGLIEIVMRARRVADAPKELEEHA